MISSQARSLGGGPTTGSMRISFALGGAAAPMPQPVTQQEATENNFKGGDVGVTQQHIQARGQPLVAQANAGEMPII